jgi:chromate reductase
VAQQHLRQVLGDLGALVMGGEAYVAFKPGLIDDVNAVTDGGTRPFLQSFMDRFVELAARLRNVETSSRAA